MKLWANLLYPKPIRVEERASSEEWAEGTEKPHLREADDATVTLHTTEQVRESVTTHNNNNYHTTEASETSNVYRTEVHVEVTNHNEIRDASDMEALADRFAEGLREKLYAAVEGVFR